jgi:glycosyltransferase involved in cell wall biosynthesis
MAIKLTRRLKARLILDIFDLWPELFILAFPRPLKPLAPILLSPLFWLKKYTFYQADALTALCKTYIEKAKEDISKFHAVPAKIIFNGIDVEAFRTLFSDNDERSDLIIKIGKQQGDISVIFAGTLGNNYDIKTILQAALEIEKRGRRIKIWIAGEGPLKSHIINFIKDKRPANLVYLGKLSHHDLAKIYHISDIGLCSYRPESNVAMPDKVYDYMAAGLPIVNSLRGELEDILINYQIGIQYIAGDPKSLADALESLAFDGEKRMILGKNSYNLAMKFDQHFQYNEFVNFIEEICQN